MITVKQLTDFENACISGNIQVVKKICKELNPYDEACVLYCIYHAYFNKHYYICEWVIKNCKYNNRLFSSLYNRKHYGIINMFAHYFDKNVIRGLRLDNNMGNNICCEYLKIIRKEYIYNDQGLQLRYFHDRDFNNFLFLYNKNKLFLYENLIFYKSLTYDRHLFLNPRYSRVEGMWEPKKRYANEKVFGYMNRLFNIKYQFLNCNDRSKINKSIIKCVNAMFIINKACNKFYNKYVLMKKSLKKMEEEFNF